MRTNENTETGTAWTTRQVSFPRYDAQGRVYGVHRAPAGTLFAQDVHPSAVAFKVTA